ncbi:methyltransferase [Ectopseudomonas hydrolytica]|uniref:methyltransferase n=1 Tax=Ectopseudomonas hydrolytica TaxID=2493633 RepID=UPI003EE245BA
MRQALYFVLCAVLLTFSAVSSAATTITYYYGQQGDWITSRQKNSDSACRAILSEGPGGGTTYKHVAALAGSGGGACIGDTTTGTRAQYGSWVKTTATCEHGSADGLNCDVPPEPQDCTNLSPGIFKSPSGPIINSGGRNYIATGFPPGSSVCFGGCSYSVGSAASSCYKDIGSTTSGYCNYVGTGTGDTCTEPDAALGAPGDALNPPDTPDVPPSDPNDPCHGLPGYSWSGTTCVKDPDNTNPGGDTGGDTGGGDTGGNTGGGSTGGGNSGGGDTGGGNNGGGDGSGNGDGNGSGDGGGSSGGSGNGSGNGEGDDEEEGGSGPGFCDGDDCGFVAPSYFGGAEKIPGFDESFKRVYDGVLNSPIGSAVTGIAFPSGGGVCPSGSVELFGRDIVFDGHCNLWPQISGIFTALMIAVWSLLAVRIVLSS